ncbi:MAG TPA: hypothetical protein VI756_00595, partial [Blastocatellia bacterium]
KIISPLAAGMLLGKEVLASYQRLAQYVQQGEAAQALLNAEALTQVGRSIQELPLVSEMSYIGLYYLALAMNRRGPSAYPQANQLLLEVADHAPGMFKAKALIAFGTNCNLTGDWQTGSAAHDEAFAIYRNYGASALHPFCCAQIQRSFGLKEQGDYGRSLQVLKALSPYIHFLGWEYFPLVHTYYNNLSRGLIGCGFIEKARSVSRVLASSPFYGQHPEWKETLELLSVPSGTPRLAFSFSYSPDQDQCRTSNVLVLAPRSALPEPMPVSPFHRPGNVLSIDAWRKKKKAAPAVTQPPKLRLNAAQIPLLTTQQKQAAILRFILSDDITDPALDRVLHAMIADPPRSEDEPSA